MAERNIEKNIALFQEEKPSLESYWRSVVLFGRNTACYKFSLAESLMTLAKEGKTSVTLAELAVPYSANICRHIMQEKRQATNPSSTFLEACDSFNKKNITQEELIATTVKHGFNWVIDCFHNVNGGDLPVKFFEKEGRKIILTDEVLNLANTNNAENLNLENESRWNLVETAWKLNISANLLNIHFDDKSNILFIEESFRRKDITSARGALDGYQKGKCFYCYDDIIVSDGSDNTCDVDHFFPYTLQHIMPEINLNGVWNLVLACPNCNRGADGKFAKVPAIKYLERLHKRNEFLISSHHPLRETIINQTGKTEQERAAFLREIDRKAINYLIHRWETEEKQEACF